MKPRNPRRSSTRCSRSSQFILLAGLVIIMSGHVGEARGFVAVGGRGAVAVGAGYRTAAYRGIGYGYGYYGGVTSVTNVTNVTAGTGTSLPSGALSALPVGAAPVVVFGKTYYFANGTYYSPQSYGGATIYVVANP